MKQDIFEYYKNILSKCAIFEDARLATLNNIEPYISEIQYAPGDVLFKAKEESNDVYIVIEGELEIFSPTRGVRYHRTNFDVIGEMAPILQEKRTSTVVATVDTRVIKLQAEGFIKILNDEPLVKKAIEKLVFQRILEDYLARYLQSILGNCDPQLIKLYLDLLSIVELKKGEVLYNQGDYSDAFYVLVSGRLEIDSTYTRISRVGYVDIGESVGEIGVFQNAPRISTITATRNSILVRYPKEFLQEITFKFPDALRTVVKTLIDRHLKTSVEKRILKPNSLAIFPLNEDLPMEDIFNGLVQNFNSLGFSLEIVTNQFSKRRTLVEEEEKAYRFDLIHTQLLMSKIEQSNDFVIYVYDPNDDHWNKQILENVDEYILIADADSSPEITDLEKKLNSFQPIEVSKRLVLLHTQSKTIPKNTKLWLEPRNFPVHYHLKWWAYKEEETARLARYLTHTATGLVFSGGGIRGFLQGGAIIALKEEKMIVDYIGGTSVGSLMGSLLAMNLSTKEVQEALLLYYKNVKFRYTLPLLSLCSGYSLEAFIHELVKGVQIEDLWVPYFAIATNMSLAKREIYRHGDLKNVILASTSLPGILPPFINENGEVIIDGGYLDNMPILQMRKELVGGSIFALDIGKTVEKDRFKSHGFTRSGWRILWNSIKRLVPFIRKKQERRDNPNIFYLLFQTTILGSDYAHRKHQNLNEADVILDFKDTPVKTTDFNLKEKTARKMINEGYEKGLKKVLEIKNDPELKKLFFR